MTPGVCLTMAVGLSILSPPLAPDWQIRSELRQEYVQRYASSHVIIEYVQAGGDFIDPDLQPVMETLGFLALDKDQVPAIFAPARLLDTVRRVRVRFSDGSRSAATIRATGSLWDRTLVRVIPRQPEILAGRPALKWATSETSLARAPGWVIETIPSVTPDGRSGHVLVDTIIGHTVEPPLTHLYYVALRRADGLPVLNSGGEIQCVVFRASPVHEELSLCAPGGDTGPPPERPTPLEVTP